MILNPHGMTVTEWADSMALLLPGTDTIEKLDDPEQWQEWAAGLIMETGLAGHDVPNPYMFSDWQEWAERLFQTTELQ